MTKIRKEQSMKSFQGGDFIKTNDMLLMDIVYLDGKLCVIREMDNTKRINNIPDTVFGYYKRTIRGFEKIFDLNVPYMLSSSSSESQSSDSSDEEIDDDDDDNITIINWADEISDEDTCNVNVPEWARIEGLDFFEREEDTIKKSQSCEVDLNQNNIVIKKGATGSDRSDIILDHEESMLVINWADEVCEMDTTNVEIPEWARIPGLDFSTKADDDNTSICSTSDYEKITVSNWADEAYNVNLEDVDVPDWAKIPGLDFEEKSNDNTNNSFPGDLNVQINKWADEACNIDMDDDVPEWAKIPGIDFNKEHNDTRVCSSPENLNTGIVNWADEVYDIDMKDVDIPDWAKIPGLDFDIEGTTSANSVCDDISIPAADAIQVDQDMNSIYFNLQRLNNRSYFLENVFGLSTIWE